MKKISPSIDPNQAAKGVDFGALWQAYGTIGILVLLLIMSSIVSPDYFLTGSNLTQILVQSSVMVLLATGVFFAILIAGIDLSVGSMLAHLRQVLSSRRLRATHWPYSSFSATARAWSSVMTTAVSTLARCSLAVMRRCASCVPVW